MTSASGFAWVAREPELIFGAEGRASSQRSTEYHGLPASAKTKLRQNWRSLRAAFGIDRANSLLTRSAPCKLDAVEGQFDARFTLLGDDRRGNSQVVRRCACRSWRMRIACPASKSSPRSACAKPWAIRAAIASDPGSSLNSSAICFLIPISSLIAPPSQSRRLKFTKTALQHNTRLVKPKGFFPPRLPLSFSHFGTDFPQLVLN